GAETAVLHQHDDDLDPFLYGGGKLLGHHQVGPVADEDEDLAVGRSELHPEATSDLVAHARVAVLHVVALWVPGAPQLVQIAGHRACRAHDDAPGTGDVVHTTDHLALRHAVWAALRTAGVGGVHGPLPCTCELMGVVRILPIDVPARKCVVERHEPGAGVSKQSDTGVLVRVEGGDVQVDESDTVRGEQ